MIVLLEVADLSMEQERPPLVFHRSGFQRLHRDDLDPARLDGRINGQPVEAETGPAEDAGDEGSGDEGADAA